MIGQNQDKIEEERRYQDDACGTHPPPKQGWFITGEKLGHRLGRGPDDHGKNKQRHGNIGGLIFPFYKDKNTHNQTGHGNK